MGFGDAESCKPHRQHLPEAHLGLGARWLRLDHDDHYHLTQPQPVRQAAGGSLRTQQPRDPSGIEVIAPPPGLVAWIAALQLRIKRMFSRTPKEA